MKTNQQIIDDAPEGAENWTHYADGNYIRNDKFVFDDWDNETEEWCFYYKPSRNIRSRKDIEALAEKDKRIAELEKYKVSFNFKHTRSGEVKTVTLSHSRIADMLQDELFEILCDCSCEPIGETNVVECGCPEYYEDFQLQRSKANDTTIQDYG